MIIGEPLVVTAADRSLADVATAALLHELVAYPKPGLVSPVDSGAHDDMDFALMCRSIEFLHRPFASLASAGRTGKGFESVLMPLGIKAEHRMLAATGGVNTHRGAIFSMGMIVAALARAKMLDTSPTPEAVRATLLGKWGTALEAHAARGDAASSHGAMVRRSTGRDGARHEAAIGFPSVFDLALPAYREALDRGLDGNAASIQTLFVLMAAIDDTTVLHRGGLPGGDFVQDAAIAFLAGGGCFSSGWQREAERLHSAFIDRRLSPGGCADLLACAILVSTVCPRLASAPAIQS